MPYRFANIILLIFLLVSIFSCEQAETALSPPTPGDVNTVQITIGFPYANQVYYNCLENQIIRTNTKWDWDLAFYSGENISHTSNDSTCIIKLNYAKGMLASDLGNSEINEIVDIKNINWQWDNSNGELNQTVIKSHNTYIINRQYDENSNHLGYYLFKVLEINDNSIKVLFRKNEDEQVFTSIINYNRNKNFTHFSFDNNGEVIEIEPNKNTWDLLFTNYQQKFDNLPLPFVITGCMINKYDGVTVAEDTLNNFSDIILSDTINYTFIDDYDIIGYDWKIRNSSDNSFKIDTTIKYIIRNNEGIFFKLRFIDFYNNTGEKGYPKFEIQKL